MVGVLFVSGGLMRQRVRFVGETRVGEGFVDVETWGKSGVLGITSGDTVM